LLPLRFAPGSLKARTGTMCFAIAKERLAPRNTLGIFDNNTLIITIRRSTCLKKSFVRKEFHVNGEECWKDKETCPRGNIRRIIIKNKEGGTVIEIPLTFGVVVRC